MLRDGVDNTDGPVGGTSGQIDRAALRAAQVNSVEMYRSRPFAIRQNQRGLPNTVNQQ